MKLTGNLSTELLTANLAALNHKINFFVPAADDFVWQPGPTESTNDRKLMTRIEVFLFISLQVK